ncbi:MAG: HNH endonuclease [Planctomycetaceae bacterium]|jgi:site-specific DNA-methyltransferase (adenine-specific)|nr:HNH endonuclease [Planctomycetaceae bacterium]
MTKYSFRNTLYSNDNLYVLSGLNSELVDLIYLDLPFNSKRMYSAPVGTKAAGASFKDMWTWKDVDEHYLNTLAENYPELTRFIASVGKIHSKAMMSYLTYMTQRIIEMHRILKNNGSFYLHCDPTASHYLKSLLDGVFGKRNFVSEIIWSYAWGVRTEKRWNKKHDTILMYAKSADFTFNSNDVLEIRKANEATQKRLKYKGAMTTDWNKGRGTEKLALPTDVWYIPTINAMSKERTGYPTQKPLALLHRIIKASSNEGDIVLDPFCGCATTCVAAQQLDRKWIGIDIEKQATKILIERLSDDAGLFKDFIATDQIPKRTDIKEIAPSETVKQRLYKQQDGKCNACGQDFEIRNLEIDHIIPKAKGGGNYYENYQLLCSSCNRRIKGDRPMEYLRMKIEVREKMLKDKIFFGE